MPRKRKARPPQTQKKPKRIIAGDRLSQFCGELEEVNEKRRKAGLVPLTYGKYVAVLEERIKPD